VQETHRAIGELWSVDGKPSFTDEVLVAHGPTKKSYHIVVKMYGADSHEVLIKDFCACKILAKMVSDSLGDRVLVDRKPGHGGKANPEPTSFIDLAIYTKDRPFRLLFSSKITSPDRPFVEECRRNPLSPEEQGESSRIVATLVVPPIAEDRRILDVLPTADTSTTSPNGSGGGAACSLAADGAGGCGQVPSSLSERYMCPIPTVASTAWEAPNADFSLLDYGRGKTMGKVIGNKIPGPFRSLLPWVETLAAGLPMAQRNGAAIKDCRYESSGAEAYVHFTLNRRYASYCHFIGRPHAENNIMISIDLLRVTAYQRCWDPTCRDPHDKAKARFLLSSHPPAGAFPTKEQIQDWQARSGLNPFWHLNSTSAFA
jgi:hypothetical protein